MGLTASRCGCGGEPYKDDHCPLYRCHLICNRCGVRPSKASDWDYAVQLWNEMQVILTSHKQLLDALKEIAEFRSGLEGVFGVGMDPDSSGRCNGAVEIAEDVLEEFKKIKEGVA